MSEHLHLIREKEPSGLEDASVHPFYCDDCEALVYVIHLFRAPVNPVGNIPPPRDYSP